MPILQCQNTGSNIGISDISDIANVIVAAATLGLAYYVFVYQKDKDKKDKFDQAEKEQKARLESLQLQEQNIKLQWFKELIIQPHLADINKFYSNLHTLQGKITTPTLDEEQRQQLIGFIKDEQTILRKTFIDVLHGVNKELYDSTIANLDNLIDSITNTIFDDGINLSHRPAYEKEIGSKITYSRNDLLSKIYNYKGI